MSALIGSTGFVGGHLQKCFEFTHRYNRSNISGIQGLATDLLICAGLPAEKWKANNDPVFDWVNMTHLAQLISTVKADRAILISTIDVYQPAINVTENDWPDLNGTEAYGRNRAWFEMFFRSHFPHATIIRLPGLFGADLKKNLIFDLLNGRKSQFMNVHKDSQFQFFDISLIWDVINKCLDNNLSVLNVATEPILAREIAGLFEEELYETEKKVSYDMKSLHSTIFKGNLDYLMSKNEIITRVLSLKQKS
jgi:nucleoside-diphosphate-sugar epimerase